MPTSPQSADAPAPDGAASETLTGLGTWIGVAESPLEPEDSPDSDTSSRADLIADQFERYRWFERRLEPRRSVASCVAALDDPPAVPAAREAAMVELSMIANTRARVALETFDPDRDDRALRAFYRICLTEMRARG